jgi:uncharacterized protein (DUF58 family)
VRRAAGIVLGGLALTLAGLTFNAAPLFVPGLAFGLIGLLTPAWVSLAARGASAERRLGAARVVEGEPLEATIEIRGGRVRAPSASVLDPLVDGPLSVRAVRGISNVQLIVRFPRRGLLQLEQPTLIVGDPLELARRERRGGRAAQELLVLPRTEPVRWSDGVRAASAARLGRTAAPPAGAAGEVDGLRPYTEGTPAARIHWPALARGAGLLERRLKDEGDTRPLVVLDARAAAREEDLDAAVRAAASIALELARVGGSSLLLPGERRATAIDPDLGSWPAAHARLALVGGGAHTPAPALNGIGPRRATLIYVAAQRLDRLPPVAHGVARGLSVLVTPGIRADVKRRASFEVSGCEGRVLRARIGARAA